MKNSLKNFLFPNKKEDQFETKLDINEDSKEKTYSNATISKENFVQSQINIESNKPAIMAPKFYKDVEMVATELLNNKSVIVDLTNTEKSEARRICDFLNGICYALNGQVSKLSSMLYLFPPTNK